MAGGDLVLAEEVDESGCLEPFFYDEAEVVAEATTKAERRRREAEEKAAEHARNVEEWTRRNAAHQAVLDRIREYDPETGEVCYTRFYHKDFSRFDIDEECKSEVQFLHIPPCNRCSVLECLPVGPVRYTRIDDVVLICSASASDAIHSQDSNHTRQPTWKTGLQPMGVGKHLLSEDSRVRCSLPVGSVWHCDCQRLR
jgi:hypothetical protein